MLIIRDNYGQAWTFTDHSIDSLAGDESFPCNDWEEGIEILNYQGFLDGSEYETETLDEHVERLR